jgi:hypothetical protein
MKSIEEALGAWRAAERRVHEANGSLTPEMAQDLAQAKQRYQDLAITHRTEQVDELPAAEGRPADARRAPAGSTR